MRLRISYKYYYLIPFFAILLSIIGLIFIYSASSYSAGIEFGDKFYHVKKQFLSLIVAIIAMLIGNKIKIEKLVRFKWIIFAIAVVLLALVFIPGLGVESYGATRWINLGLFTIQPSEISKFALVIFLAIHMAENPPIKVKDMVIPLLSGGIFCGLIMAEPNMSITVVVGATLMIMLFVGGMRNKWFIALFIVVLVGGVVLIVAEPYRMARLFAYINPWQNPQGEGYQLIQSYYALGNGGLFGVGLFNSRQKYLFLPFAESDFIFAIIGEETGFIGCLVISILFAVIILSGYKVAKNAKSRYQSLLVTGLVSIIAVQTVVNLAVVTGTIPPTGVPLPFVSAGGTSLVAFMFVIGLILNVARNQS